MTLEELMKVANLSNAVTSFLHCAGHMQECVSVMREHGIEAEQLLPVFEELFSLRFPITDLRIRLAEAQHRVPSCGCINEGEVAMVHRGRREEAARMLARRTKMSIARARSKLGRLYPCSSTK